jgi:hypothetical protein
MSSPQSSNPRISTTNQNSPDPPKKFNRLPVRIAVYGMLALIVAAFVFDKLDPRKRTLPDGTVLHFESISPQGVPPIYTGRKWNIFGTKFLGMSRMVRLGMKPSLCLPPVPEMSNKTTIVISFSGACLPLIATLQDTKSGHLARSKAYWIGMGDRYEWAVFGFERVGPGATLRLDLVDSRNPTQRLATFKIPGLTNPIESTNQRYEN